MEEIDVFPSGVAIGLLDGNGTTSGKNAVETPKLFLRNVLT